MLRLMIAVTASPRTCIFILVALHHPNIQCRKPREAETRKVEGVQEDVPRPCSVQVAGTNPRARQARFTIKVSRREVALSQTRDDCSRWQGAAKAGVAIDNFDVPSQCELHIAQSSIPCIQDAENLKRTIACKEYNTHTYVCSRIKYGPGTHVDDRRHLPGTKVLERTYGRRHCPL